MTTTAPSTRDEFFTALSEIRERPKGRATAAAAEELVDAAETFGDPEVTVSALVGLMDAYHGSGEAVKFPVTFARLLQLWDEDQKYFDDNETYRLFWYFKWVTSGLLATPDVPLASIRGWIAEMRRRYAAAGHDPAPVQLQEFHLARQLGENELLAYELWATRGRARFSDCPRCEARQRAGHHFRRDEDERGLAELQPTFDGARSCDEEPHSSQALALLPLLRLGRFDDARAAHLTGYRKIRGQEAELIALGQHLEFCALTGNEARGLELLAQNRASFDFLAAPSSRLDFLTGVEVLLARLVETGHGELPCPGPLGTEWTAASLRDDVAAQADGLAARFDARNGNDTVSTRRRERLTRRPLVAQLNLGVQTAALARPADQPSAPTPSAAPAVAEVPADFTELVAEARRLDRTGHPRGQALWTAVIERAESEQEAVDDEVRGDIACELAQRAARHDDWAVAAEQLDQAVEFYAKAGRQGRKIAAEARVAWCAAVREDGVAAVAAAEAVWPVLDDLLARVGALVAAAPGTGEEAQRTLRQRAIVRHCRMFTARQAMQQAEEPEQRDRWTERFSAESQELIAEGAADEVAAQVSVAHEVLAEFHSGNGDPARGEESARRAIEIFEQQGWPWRVPRARLMLALALSGQRRTSEAMAELERGLAEAPADVEAGELTQLHRLLGHMALGTRQYRTAVRALSEAAAQLDRSGSALEARETRLQLGRALWAQGSAGDAVAVLESLLDPAGRGAPTVPTDPTDPTTPSDPAAEPSEADQLAAQIRIELANALQSMGEPRDAAAHFLQMADFVSHWPDQRMLTSAAAGAAGALGEAGNWDGAQAALERAFECNRRAQVLPDLNNALRVLAVAAVEARGQDAADEALGYLDQADQLLEEFPDIASRQFHSVDVDRAESLHTRGRVLATVDRSEEALAAFEQTAALYDRAGRAASSSRFEALRLAALVEARSLERPDAARARLDRAIAEAEAADRSEIAAELRRTRDRLN